MVSTGSPDAVARAVGDVHGSIGRDRQGPNRVGKVVSRFDSGRGELHDRLDQAAVVDSPHL